MANEIYEIFGKKVRVVQDPNEIASHRAFRCSANCALYDECCNDMEICRDANKLNNRHFELVE